MAARRTLRLQAQFAERTGVELGELDLGGGFGIAYTSTDTPATPHELASALAEIIAAECSALGLRRSALSIEPGRAISGPSAFALYEVGTVKPVAVDEGASRLYVSVDGGMSDNIRPLSTPPSTPPPSPPGPATRPPCSPAWSASTARGATSWCATSSCPPTSGPAICSPCPASGAYSRSMASNYNHVPRPPVVAVRDGVITTLVRRETLDDLLALDVG